MKTVYHAANTRGNQNHGWLNANHSFSFANYYDPSRMNFGALRVLNDDDIAAGMGFGTHPHNNMEIITLPLKGDLEHKDSMGYSEVIKEGDIQVLSAGTGIEHSEYNKNRDKPINLLQLWIFPNKQNVTPRYEQLSIRELKNDNQFYQILSPNSDDAGVWIHQNAWMHLGEFNDNEEKTYTLKDSNNGVYVFVIEGETIINDKSLTKRDALGVWDTRTLTLKPGMNSKIFLIEVPMKF
jgi:redox-sensitive bicupin YhaK (pirin superfamily)